MDGEGGISGRTRGGHHDWRRDDRPEVGSNDVQGLSDRGRNRRLPPGSNHEQGADPHHREQQRQPADHRAPEDALVARLPAPIVSWGQRGLHAGPAHGRGRGLVLVQPVKLPARRGRAWGEVGVAKDDRIVGRDREVGAAFLALDLAAGERVVHAVLARAEIAREGDAHRGPRPLASACVVGRPARDSRIPQRIQPIKSAPRREPPRTQYPRGSRPTTNGRGPIPRWRGRSSAVACSPGSNPIRSRTRACGC